MKRLAVLTSGGDAPGMNAAVRAVVRNTIFHKSKIYGIMRGFSGLVHDEFFEMSLGSVADIIHKGGTILHTARCDEFSTPDGIKKALNNLNKYNIDGLIIIGGDGSFRGALELARLGFCTIGVPGTIDNDVSCTDSSIGFDTAVNTAVDAINKVRDTATSHERTFIIEVMGRDRGDIALHSGIAGGAESILIPEVKTDINDVAKKILKGLDRGKLHSVIIVAEGAGSAFDVGEKITDITGLETRVTVLGHIQRGGSPSAFDRIIASRMGAKAVDLIFEGIKGHMVGVSSTSIAHYDMEFALQQKKEFNFEMLELADILSI